MSECVSQNLQMLNRAAKKKSVINQKSEKND